MALVLGTLCRLEPERSVHKAILAFSKIHKNNKNTKLVIGGTGSQLEVLKKLSIHLNIDEYVEFTGNVSNLDEFYAHIDIVLNTISLDGDNGAGVGNNMIEAGLYKKPVVTFDSCGIKEMIINNKTGFCIQYFNLDTFVEKLQNLIENPDIRQEFANNLHAHVTSECSNNRIYNDLIKAYTN